MLVAAEEVHRRDDVIAVHPTTSPRAHAEPLEHLSITLHPRAPFRLDLSVWAIRRRPNNLVDRWDGRTYQRVILVDGRPINMEVVAAGTPTHPTLRVTASGAVLAQTTRAAVTDALERILGLQIDLRAFYRLASADPVLSHMVAHFRGVKPPRFPTMFEAVVNGIACQQLSLNVAIILLGRLAQRYGCSITLGAAVVHAFPCARDLVGLQPSDLRVLGFSEAKARALLELAANVHAGLDLESLSSLANEDVIASLSVLRGIGRWTAEYVLLRGLGRIDLFPGNDVGARTNLARWMKLKTPLDYDQVRALVRHWHPYAGFLYFHLLLQRIEEAKQLDPVT